MNKVVLLVAAMILSGCQEAASITVSKLAWFLSFFVNPDGTVNLSGYIIIFSVVLFVFLMFRKKPISINSILIFLSIYIAVIIYQLLFGTPILGI